MSTVVCFREDHDTFSSRNARNLMDYSAIVQLPAIISMQHFSQMYMIHLYSFNFSYENIGCRSYQRGMSASLSKPALCSSAEVKHHSRRSPKHYAWYG